MITSNQQLDDVLIQADQLRVQGEWGAALAHLATVQPAADSRDMLARAKHSLAVGRVLIDQAGFSGFDTWVERSSYLARALADAQQANDLALLGAIWDARGNSLHHHYLDTGRTTEPAEELSSFEAGLRYRQQADDQRGIAESLFHVGLVYGVVRQDHQQALPFFEQAYALAQTLGDTITASYAIRHIGFAHYHAGNLAQVHAAMQTSLRLREQAQFLPGVAMALVALAYADFDAELKSPSAALEHLERAQTIFTTLQAEKKAAWVKQLLSEFGASERDTQ